MVVARTRLVAALVALGLVVAAWLAGDGGGARAALGDATGPLIAVAPGNAAVLVAEGLRPGDARAGEVTVTNAGDASGAFAVSASDVVDTSARLSGVLDLAVRDVTPGRAVTPVYTGVVADLRTVELGTLAQGETRRYRFTVSFPSGRPDAIDNLYQGASTAVTFVWSTPSAAGSTSAGAPARGGTPTTGAPGIAVSPTISRPAALATLIAGARQSGTGGVVIAAATCRAACRIALGGTASSRGVKLPLRTVRGTLPRAGRVRMRVVLPARSRAALAAGRTVTVRLRLTTKVGKQVVEARRTVRVTKTR
jgi:hypothetical protein